MHHRFLADALVTVHLAFIAFAVLGGLLVLWKRWWAALHVPAIAWAVNISQNGRLAVAALSDGTIRWYRMADGKEMLAYLSLIHI